MAEYKRQSKLWWQDEFDVEVNRAFYRGSWVGLCIGAVSMYLLLTGLGLYWFGLE